MEPVTRMILAMFSMCLRVMKSFMFGNNSRAGISSRSTMANPPKIAPATK